jgi:hypothetical protein
MLFFEYFYGLLRVFKAGWKETNLPNIRIDIHFSRLMVLRKRTSVRKIWMLGTLVSTHPLRWLPKSSARQATFGVFVIDVFFNFQTSKWIDDVRTERGSDVIIMLVGSAIKLLVVE